MTVHNRTPHSVTVGNPEAFTDLEKSPLGSYFASGVNKEKVKTFPSEGEIRVKIDYTPSTLISDIPTKYVKFNRTETNLPNFVDGTYYIVSSLVIEFAKTCGRPLEDLLTPGDIVRKKSNPSEVLGCLFLAKHKWD